MDGNNYQPCQQMNPYYDSQLELEEPVKISEWVLALVFCYYVCGDASVLDCCCFLRDACSLVRPSAHDMSLSVSSGRRRRRAVSGRSN